MRIDLRKLFRSSRIQLCCLALVSSLLWAADPDPNPHPEWIQWIEDPLEFNAQTVKHTDDLIPLLLSRNSSIQASYFQWQAMSASQGTVVSLPDPSFAVGSFLEPIETANGPQNFKFSLNQGIPWPGKTRAQRELLDARTAQAMEDLHDLILKQVSQLRKLVNEAAFLNRLIALQEEKLRLAEDLEVILDTKYSSGGVSHALRIEEQIRRQLLRDQLAGSKDQRQRVSIELSTLLELDGLLDVSALEFESSPIGNSDLPELKLDHPRIGRVQQLIREAEAQSDLARAAFYPDLHAGLDYIVTGKKQMNGVEVPDSGQDPIVFSIGTQLPLWNWKQNRSRLATSQWQKKRALAVLDLETNRLKAGETLALSRLDQAQRTLQLYGQVLLPQGLDKAGVLEQSYITDGSDFQSYINAQLAVLDLKIQMETTRKTILDQLAELSYWRNE